MNRICEPGTDKTRFDYMTMQEEWRDFLEVQCGYDKADPALVAALTSAHAGMLSQVLSEHFVAWNDLEGVFAVPEWIYQANEGKFPLTREDLDMVWSNCFDYVNECFDEIEERVEEERARGLF